jgi:hypothetical protein
MAVIGSESVMASGCLGELEDVVGGADQRPFGFHFVAASEQELPEVSCLFDLPEDRLNDLLSEPVAPSPSGPPQSLTQKFLALAKVA